MSLYKNPVIFSAPELNFAALQQYTAQDIAGVFDFTFQPNAIQNECQIIPPVQFIDFTVNAINNTQATFFFSIFPYPNPSLGSGQVSGNHFSGIISDNDVSGGSDELNGCTFDVVFTLEMDIVGPGQIDNATGTFEITDISGSCSLNGSSCTSIFEISID
jgi:hypothetical protein